MNKVFISWGEFTEDVKELAKIFEEKEKIEEYYGIITVARGGLVPCGLFAYHTGINKIITENVSYYSENDEKLEKPIVDDLFSVSNEVANQRWIILDDLADTGATLKFLKNKYPNSISITPYVKTLSKPFINHFVKEYSNDVWIVLPWD